MHMCTVIKIITSDFIKLTKQVRLQADCDCAYLKLIAMTLQTADEANESERSPIGIMRCAGLLRRDIMCKLDRVPELRAI